MGKLKFIGEIVHGEKYEDKDGKGIWRNTNLGALFIDEEKNRYTIKFLGQWINVFPPKATDKDFKGLKDDIQKNAPKTREQQKAEFEDEIPF